LSKMQRDKGKRGERKAVKALLPLFPRAARDLNDVYKKEGIDLLRTGALAVQVKHYRDHCSINKLREVVPEPWQYPALISWPTNRKDRPTITFFLDDYVDFTLNPKKLQVNVGL